MVVEQLVSRDYEAVTFIAEFCLDLFAAQEFARSQPVSMRIGGDNLVKYRRFPEPPVGRNGRRSDEPEAVGSLREHLPTLQAQSPKGYPLNA
jgi:hypothetical protein